MSDPGATGAVHPVGDLPDLVAGQLDLAAVRRLTAHLRSCEACRRELVEVVGGSAALHLVGRDDEAAGATPLPPLVLDALAPVPVAAEATPIRTGHRRRNVVIGAVAAAIVAVALVVSVMVTRSSGPATVSVALKPVGGASASGTVSMTTGGSERTMTVDATVAPPSGGAFYEVWLLETATGRMVSVGVLPSDGKGRYTLPAQLVAAYDSVDVSLEPDDGVPAHSSDSVLRASYGPTA
jgi:hypothetical protein